MPAYCSSNFRLPDIGFLSLPRKTSLFQNTLQITQGSMLEISILLNLLMCTKSIYSSEDGGVNLQYSGNWEKQNGCKMLKTTHMSVVVECKIN